MNEAINLKTRISEIFERAKSEQAQIAQRYGQNKSTARGFIDGVVFEAFKALEMELRRQNRSASCDFEGGTLSASLEVTDPHERTFTYRIEVEVTPTKVTAFAVAPVRNEQTDRDEPHKIQIAEHDQAGGEMVFTREQVIEDFLSKYDSYLSAVARGAWQRTEQSVHRPLRRSIY